MSGARVAILVVSDTASLDPSADRSGPALQSLLTQAGYVCTHLEIVPDDETRIRTVVLGWCDHGDVDWIVTTGGTGFGLRDRTPEAIKPLLDREAPGLVALILNASLQATPLAALSRPVAGTIKNTLIVTLPGSVKAVQENTAALLQPGVIEHAIELVRGGTGRRVHEDLETEGVRVPAEGSVVSAGSARSGSHHHHNGNGHVHSHTHSPSHTHSHGHGHDHGHSVPQPRSVLSQDPGLPAHARPRESPYPLVTIADALLTILREIRPLPVYDEPVSEALRGLVIAEDVYAPQNVPATFTTNVDGYAIRSTDPPGIYRVLTSRNHLLSIPVPPGAVFRVNTGGPLPAGTDAVIMVEDTRVYSTQRSPTGEEVEENEIETLAQVSRGENVRDPGSDVRQGDLVLERGTVVNSSGGEIGTLAFVGRTRVRAHRKPVVALLSTGNELLDVQAPNPLPSDGWGGIWDTNRPSLKAALVGLGYEVVDLGIVPDNLQAHVEALQRGLGSADLILTTGGTSMGVGDLLKPVIEYHLGGTIHFGRVRVKPGKPTTFASIPTPGERVERVPLFALPGNPASALVMFHIFVIPALRRLGGWPEVRCRLPSVRVQIQESLRLDPRPEYHRAIIRVAPEGLKAYSTGGQRSSRVASLKGANGLIALPPRVEGGASKLEIGDYVEAILIGELQMA
ncbi:molybdenum cofactor biosynthesis protein [Dichomitus squalens LYAD-421 SS1]|uniref:Molybdenum cofactor biosynthesis protein n=2 Tax=Dichomitus squalens TaxID=114155 RepID=A0A4Q9Q9C5_9APHY|nr:molybdenum cofactor biosynthesis protein [Dichomitus squalens LYAD-421 SS1]EJF62323.1 molybdenum cofactor biosynthesis protein [Dichomitus squalens LYAD-421 SS1]TBU63224.1 molybdenum cofactor biosynthesis protein [Dichomitus squalens]